MAGSIALLKALWKPGFTSLPERHNGVWQSEKAGHKSRLLQNRFLPRSESEELECSQHDSCLELALLAHPTCSESLPTLDVGILTNGSGSDGETSFYSTQKKLVTRLELLAGAGDGKTMLLKKMLGFRCETGKPLRNLIEVTSTVAFKRAKSYYGCGAKKLAEQTHHQQTNQVFLTSHTCNSSCMCSILDGLDEVFLGLDAGNTFIQDVTSRYIDVCVIENSSILYSLYQLLLVRPGDVHQAENWIGVVRMSGQGECFMQPITSYSDLSLPRSVPFLEVILSKLFQHGSKTEADTVSGVQNSTIHESLLQAEEMKACQGRPRLVWSGIEPSSRKEALDLADFTFRMLIKKVTVFNEQPFQDQKPLQEARFLGLVVTTDCPGHGFPFLHLPFHEALSTLFISPSSQVDITNIPWLLPALGPLNDHLSTFWWYLARELDIDSYHILDRVLQDQPSADSTQQQPPKAGQSPFPIDDITEFSTAAYASVITFEDILSQRPTVNDARKLTDRLLIDILLGGGKLAVGTATGHQGVEVSNTTFLKERVFPWRHWFPRGSIDTLYAATAIAQIRHSSASRCFPRYKHLHSHPSGCEQSAKSVDLKTDDDRSSFLLACHCYSAFKENSECAGSGAADQINGFGMSLKNITEINFDGFSLTTGDCRAIGCFLCDFNNHITSFSAFKSHMGNDGYSQLATGLQACHNLCYLDLALNDLTDDHVHHIASIVQGNSATLQTIKTAYNNFTSAGNANIHRYTMLCANLSALHIGGSFCTDNEVNMRTVSSVLASCPDLTYIGLSGCSLGSEDLQQLNTLLSSHQISVLFLRENHLTSACTPVLDKFLAKHQDHLEVLALERNTLTDDFLLGVEDTLSACSRLSVVSLRCLRLSSRCLPVLGSLMRQWPHLTHLQLSHNDLSDPGGGVEMFANALCSCPGMEVLRMPDGRFTSPQLRSTLENVINSSINVEFSDAKFWDEAGESD